MSEESSHELPESDLSNEQAMAVLKQLEQSSMLRISYPSAEPQYDPLFSLQIVGTLKFDKEMHNVVIQDGDSRIEFQLTSDFAFEYVDSLHGHPYIGKSLTIIGKNFSLEIEEIVAKVEEEGGPHRSQKSA